MRLAAIGAMLLLAVAISSARAGFTFQACSPTAYSASTVAMDAALGISGSTIEDFEDEQLIPGLSYTLVGYFTGPNAQPVGPFTTIRTLARDDTHVWDGGHVMENHTPTTPGDYRTRTIFTLPANVSRVGIGMSDFNFTGLDWYLKVNNTTLVPSVSATPQWQSQFARNAYFVITSADATPISTLEIGQTAVTNTIEGVAFDHLALSTGPIPEPTSLAWLTLIALTPRRRSKLAAVAR